MSAPPAWYDDKDVATVADLGTSGAWVEQRLDDSEVAAFVEITQCSVPADGLPQGLAPMIGRLGYLAGRRSPPGGVLARLQWRNLSRLPGDGRVLVRAHVVADEERRGRRRVTVDTHVAHPDQRPIAELTWHLVWPDGAP